MKSIFSADGSLKFKSKWKNIIDFQLIMIDYQSETTECKGRSQLLIDIINNSTTTHSD